MAKSIYSIAWRKLDEALNQKTSWGREDLRKEMRRCVEEAVDEYEREASA